MTDPRHSKRLIPGLRLWLKTVLDGLQAEIPSPSVSAQIADRTWVDQKCMRTVRGPGVEMVDFAGARKMPRGLTMIIRVP